VEDVQNSTPGQGGAAGGQPAKGRVDRVDGRASQDEPRQPSSGFADLSTWCCDVFVPARSSLNRSGARASSLEDQPTVALSGLFSPQPFHLADVPTVPMPPSLKPVAIPLPASAGSGLRQVHEKRRGRLRRFWLSLWRFCFCRPARSPRPARQRRSARNRGRELILERLRERSQQSAQARTPPAPPGGKRTRIEPPPVDRLFG
jgi:hypothetical protein